MAKSEAPSPLRIAVLQRVCTAYRKRLFQRLAAREDVVVRLFIGADVPDTKVRSTPDLSGLDVEELPTRFYRIGNDIICDHRGLGSALGRFEPDVILCEAESSSLSYLKAVRYRMAHPQVGLVNWGLGLLPGAPSGPFVFRYQLRRVLLWFFDTCVSYSSFGARALEGLGFSPEDVFVAVNVCDTDFHLLANDNLEQTRSEARAALGLPERFTALYVGAIDPRKRLDDLLHACSQLPADRYGAVIVGDGPSLPDLERLRDELELENVSLVGRVSDGLPSYYRAADALVLPGRGGMVLSEAMSYGLPTVVHQADGTESDLVVDGETGIQLRSSGPEAIRGAMVRLAEDPAASEQMGRAGNALIRERFNQEAMIQELLRACHKARAHRRER
jgi:glycosyltransferase involved in cell wall biosynthesis